MCPNHEMLIITVALVVTKTIPIGVNSRHFLVNKKNKSFLSKTNSLSARTLAILSGPNPSVSHPNLYVKFRVPVFAKNDDVLLGAVSNFRFRSFCRGANEAGA